MPDTYIATDNDSPHDLAFHNGKLYFGSKDENGNDKLYFLDNGVPTKILAADVAGLSSPYSLIFIGYSVFFVAYDGIGTHLYQFDGTNLTIPHTLGSTNESPSILTVAGNNLYFSLDNHGPKLFKYNLTNTIEITSIMGANLSDAPTEFGGTVAFGSNLFFSATNTVKSKFYMTDGVSVNQVSDTNNTYDYNPEELIAFDHKIYFRGITPEGHTKLYSTNGITVTQISNINPGGNDYPNSFFVYGNKLYFSAEVAPNRYKLFSYNGSAVDQISDINPGGNDEPSNFFEYDSRLCFSGRNNVGYSKIFCFNGITISQLPEINSNGEDHPGDFLVSGPKLYFTAYSDGISLKKVYQFDGTIASKIGDTTDSLTTDDPSSLVMFKNNLYFSARDLNTNRKLFKFNGVSISQAIDINFQGNDNPTQLVANDNFLYFSAYNEAGLEKLFAFDEINKIQISNTAGLLFSDVPYNLKMIDNKLFVNLSIDDLMGNQWMKLFAYEGITPLQISNTNQDGLYGYNGDDPYNVTKLGHNIFYVANWKTKKQKLYIYSNEVESLATILSPGMNEQIYNIVALDGSIYFTANFGGEYATLRKIYKYTP